MTTPMAISRCFRFSNNIYLRSLIQLHLNPITTANSIETASESQSKPRLFETIIPNLRLQNDVAAEIRNQVGLSALYGGGKDKNKLLARGRLVKIDDEFNDEDVEDDSDEFEDEDEDDEDEFDEMDGENCEDDDEDEDPVYKKRK